MTCHDQLRRTEKQIVVLRRLRRQKRDRQEPYDHLYPQIEKAKAEANRLRSRIQDLLKAKQKGIAP